MHTDNYFMMVVLIIDIFCQDLHEVSPVQGISPIILFYIPLYLAMRRDSP